MATAQKPEAEHVGAGRRLPVFAIGLGVLVVLAVLAFFMFGMDPLDSRVAASMPDTGQAAGNAAAAPPTN
jgi:hypothetical protein